MGVLNRGLGFMHSCDMHYFEVYIKTRIEIFFGSRQKEDDMNPDWVFNTIANAYKKRVYKITIIADTFLYYKRPFHTYYIDIF